MSKIAGFFDSSALVPLCLHEDTTRQARAYFQKFVPVVWWGSIVEIHSAIQRSYRSAEINDSESQGAMARLALLGHGWKEIIPGDQVRHMAVRLLAAHDLRAADSLQLAAALTWCGERPARRNFVCADQRLARAAEVVGFSVLKLG